MRIITLSTIPPRFHTLGHTLDSLLRQTGKIDEVRLYIPRSYKRFPEYAGELPDIPSGITLVRPDHDLGPATKVLFATKQLRGANAQILFCDDDKIFNQTWAERLFKEQTDRPGECVALFGKTIDGRYGRSNAPLPHAVRNGRNPFALRARRIAHLLGGGKGPRPQRIAIKRAGYADILMGLGGVVVRPDFFDEEAQNIPPVVWAVDDVWLSGLLAKKGIKIWLPAGLEMPQTSEANDVSSLHSSTIEGAKRSDANRLCVEYMQSTYGIWR